MLCVRHCPRCYGTHCYTTQDAFVDRELLDVKLMHPLVKVLTAPPPRRQSTTDDPDDPLEEEEKEDVVCCASCVL